MAAVGIELGESVIRAAALERHGSQPRLVACAQVPWSGAVEDLQPALAQLRRALPISQPVILGLPTTSAIVATVQPLIVQSRRAALAVQFELQQQLPYEIGQAVWHYQWRPGNGTSQAVVAGAKRTAVDDYLQGCRRAGLAVRAVSVNVFGAINLWSQQARAGQSSGILLHLDGLIAEWIVINSSGLHVVPLRLPSEEGQAGSAAPIASVQTALPDACVEVLKASWNSLAEMGAQGSVGAGAARSPVQSGARAAALVDARPTVWLMGVSSPELVERLKRELGCDVAPLPVSRLIKADGSYACQPDGVVAACGLALQELGMGGGVSVNLLSELQRERQRKLVEAGARSVAVLGIVLSLWFAGKGMLTALRAKRELLQHFTAQEQVYQKLRPEVKTVLHRQARLEHRLRQLQDVMLGRTLVIQAFEQAIEALPDEIWLTRVEFSKNEALYGLLEGRSRSFPGVTRFMNQLKSSVGWGTVKLLGTTVKTAPEASAEVIAFTIEVQQPLPAASTETSSSATDEE